MKKIKLWFFISLTIIGLLLFAFVKVFTFVKESEQRLKDKEKIVIRYGKKNMMYYPNIMKSGRTHENHMKYSGDTLTHIFFHYKIKDGKVQLMSLSDVKDECDDDNYCSWAKLIATQYSRDGKEIKADFDEFKAEDPYSSSKESGKQYGLTKYLSYAEPSKRLASFAKFVTMGEDNTPIRLLSVGIAKKRRGNAGHKFMYNQFVEVRMGYKHESIKDWQFIEDTVRAYIDTLYAEAATIQVSDDYFTKLDEQLVKTKSIKRKEEVELNKRIVLFGKKDIAFPKQFDEYYETSGNPKGYAHEPYSEIHFKAMYEEGRLRILPRDSGCDTYRCFSIRVELYASEHYQNGKWLDSDYKFEMDNKHTKCINHTQQYGLTKCTTYYKENKHIDKRYEFLFTLRDDKTPIRFLKVNAPTPRSGGVRHYFMYNDLVYVDLYYRKEFIEDWQGIENAVRVYIDQLYAEAKNEKIQRKANDKKEIKANLNK